MVYCLRTKETLSIIEAELNLPDAYKKKECTANLISERINTQILHVGSTHRDFSFEGERIPFNGGYF